MFVCTFLYMYTWVYTSEVNAKRIRERYLQAVLKQEIAYFDDVGAGEVATRIQTDTRKSHLDSKDETFKSCLTQTSYNWGYPRKSHLRSTLLVHSSLGLSLHMPGHGVSLLRCHPSFPVSAL